MNAYSPDANYGANTTVAMGVLLAGGSKNQMNRPIANFDVSALPGGVLILEAKMFRTLTIVDPSPHSCQILRCRRTTTWSESGVTWNKYDGVNNWTSAGAYGEDTDQATPAPVSYNESTVTGDHEITGLGGFVRDAIDNRGSIVSIVMRNIDEAPPVSQRSIWLADVFWKLIIDYDPIGLVGGLSEPQLPVTQTRRAARAHQPAAAGRPAPPHRAAQPR